MLTGSVLVGVIIGAFVLPAYLAEQFPVHVRATGLGLAYGIGSAVIGGTAPLRRHPCWSRTAGAGRGARATWCSGPSPR